MQKLDLRVGKISEVHEHPNADKLYITRVDLGDEQRTLVAGLKPYYDKDEMEGKKIVVVTNLEPAKLRGVKSEGMMLAAQDDDIVSLLEPEGEVGAQIVGTTKGAEQISFSDFQEYEFVVGKVEDGVFKADKEYDLQGEPGVEGLLAALVKNDVATLLKDDKGGVGVDREVSPGSEVL